MHIPDFATSITCDPDGEVIFATTSTLTQQVFNGLPSINRAYFRLRHLDHMWLRSQLSLNSSQDGSSHEPKDNTDSPPQRDIVQYHFKRHASRDPYRNHPTDISTTA